MSDSNGVPIGKQEQYWDMWQEARSINPWAQRRSRIMLNLLRTLRLANPRILDFGCGNGWFCPDLAELGQVTGIDLSRSNMEKAQQRFPDIEFIGANLFEHPLPSEHFDIVVSQQVIAHVSDQSGYVDRCATLLKPGGYLVLSTNNKIVMDRLGDKYVDDRALGHLENWLSLAELKKMLGRQFEVVHDESIIPRGQYGFLRFVNSPKLNGLLGLCLRAETIERVKEKLGLGYVNIVLAKRA